MKIVHHYANSCFDWLKSGHQIVNPSREAISILSGKYKRFTFVHPVTAVMSVLTNDSVATFYKITEKVLLQNLVGKSINYFE